MSTRHKRPTSVINLNTSAGARAENRPYRLRTPVLMLDFGATSVLVTTATATRITAADVEFARQLAEQAAGFATCVERMYRGVAAATGVER
ncbi:hypothetical protein EDD27_8885 [Nonomuraea polychroma]|uniref:Uncharacterized protein n=1 Tax=Nonomuraea polychroma TaxID=46176 RepID=A0A438MK42_9ACTN|nr:hypothetical protein [Nonomuraea polychroma]RVX46043.1 hypothetical protein EDD27_8885 [Nonomuraea polychroma]